MATLSSKNVAYAIYEASHKKEGKDLDAVLAHATIVLASKHLLGRSKEILQSLQEIIDEKEGVVRAKVESASKLSKKLTDEIEDELKMRYKADTVYLDMIENKKLLGGIKIQVGDEIIDLTLSHKIHQLQNYLIEN